MAQQVLAFLGVLSLSGVVLGHGQMTKPIARPDANGATVSSGQREPVFTLNGPRTASWGGDRGYPNSVYPADAYRCHGFTTKSPENRRRTVRREPRSKLVAGQPFTYEVYFEANHPGDCFLYLSAPGQDQTNPSMWYKIAQFPGCGSPVGLAPPAGYNSFTFTVPEGVPACDNCVLRWEWYAVQQVTNIEFYVTCADVLVENQLGVGSVLTGMTTISGIEHLPQNADSYRKAYNNQYGERYLVGPALATYMLVKSDGTSSTVSSSGAITATDVPTTTTSLPPSPGGCSLEANGGKVDSWNGGFVVNDVKVKNGKKDTLIEWSWVSPVTITNSWNVAIDNAKTTTSFVSMRAVYDGATFGLQATGNYAGIKDLTIDGVPCSASGTTGQPTSTTTSTTTTVPHIPTTTSTTTSSAACTALTTTSTVTQTVTKTVTATVTAPAVTSTTTTTTTATTAATTTATTAATTAATTTKTTTSTTPTSAVTLTPTSTTTGSVGCSFASAGAQVDQWNGGFVVNNAKFDNGQKGTVISWEWGSGSVSITNIWNAKVDTAYTTTNRVRITTEYNGATFGFQGTGVFNPVNLQVNGQACGAPTPPTSLPPVTSTTTSVSTATSTSVPSGRGLRYVGLNAAGLDFGTGNVPGQINIDYIAPKSQALDYWMSQGATVFRLPFAWERLQITLRGSLDGPAANVIDNIINYVTSKNVAIILDPHNNECGVCFKKQAVTKRDLAGLWSAIAKKYGNNQKVIFGLYNEPMNNGEQFDVATWRMWAQTSITAIRATSASNLILVPGVFWSGAHSWVALNDAMKDIVDNNFAYDIHQYFDHHYSGTQSGCAGAAGAQAGVQQATSWLAANNKQAFMGEVNMVVDASDNQCKDAMYALLDYVKANNNQWLGFSLWAFAPWGIQMNLYDTQPTNNAYWFSDMGQHWG